MLPYFAATGHNNYFKAVSMYVQKMLKLAAEHPNVFKKFMEEGGFVTRRVTSHWGAVAMDLFIEQELMRTVKSKGGLTHGKGMTESQQIIWLTSRPICCELSSKIDELCGKHKPVEKINIDNYKSRLQRDLTDTLKVVEYFRSASVFSGTARLRSLATGIEASPHVNADSAREVGISIMKNVSGKRLGEVKLSKKFQVVSMDASPVVPVGATKFNIDPMLLFQRLVSVHRDKQEFPGLFRFELCTLPASLFEANGLMRDPSKSQMKESLLSLSRLSNAPVKSQPSADISYVVDGGSLLHSVRWPKNKPFSEIFLKYLNELNSLKRPTFVIFDGYGEEPSTKDEAHARRYGKNKRVSHIAFTPTQIPPLAQDELLSNPVNKSSFISYLSNYLTSQGIDTFVAPGDADLFIVLKALDLAEFSEVVVKAEDTDILVLLLHHLRSTSKKIFMSGNTERLKQILPISDMRRVLGLPLCRSITFLHALLGCDTTSRLYGIRRRDVLDMCSKHHEVSQAAEVFLSPCATEEDITRAGLATLIRIYGGEPGENLHDIRHRKFVSKVATCKRGVEPKSLPPTEDAASLHLKRVYLQVQQWNGNVLSGRFNPLNWGWTLSPASQTLKPQMMTLPPAPEELLKVVRCNCKGDCSTLKCSCIANGLTCTLACGQCRGSGCSNSSDPTEEEENVDNPDY